MKSFIWKVQYALLAWRFYGKYSWQAADTAADCEIDCWGNNPDDWESPKDALIAEISYMQ